MPYGSEEKLNYEVEKLIAEVRVLKKPWLLPTFWLALVGLSASVSYNIYQFYTSDVKTEKAKNESAKAGLELERIDLDKTRKESELGEINTKLDSAKNALANIKKEISDAQAGPISSDTKTALQQAEQNIVSLQKSIDATSESLKTTEAPSTKQFRSEIQLARAKEREGFQALIKGDYQKAADAFQAAEDAFNGYHSVYDIAKLLKETKSQRGDPVKMKEVRQKVATEFSYLAPSDLLQELRSVAK